MTTLHRGLIFALTLALPAALAFGDGNEHSTPTAIANTMRGSGVSPGAPTPPAVREISPAERKHFTEVDPPAYPDPAGNAMIGMTVGAGFNDGADWGTIAGGAISTAVGGAIKAAKDVIHGATAPAPTAAPVTAPTPAAPAQPVVQPRTRPELNGAGGGRQRGDYVGPDGPSGQARNTA